MTSSPTTRRSHQPGCSVDDWECVRATSYIYPNTLPPSVVSALEADGFEIALHVNTDCADWTPASLDGFYDDQLATFAELRRAGADDAPYTLHHLE